MKPFVKPPRLPVKLLRFYCSDERLEEIEGDLNEVFNEFIDEHGSRFSKLFFWWLVVRDFRSHALKRKKMKNKGLISTSFMFLRHNVLITWRNLLKHKTTSFINIFGLAIGISSFLVIFRIVQFELSFNRKIPEGSNIYRIHTEFSGSFDAVNRGVSTGVSRYIQENLTRIKTVSHFHDFSANVHIPIEVEDSKDFGKQDGIILADSNYFKIANQYVWLLGSPETSLNEPFQVVLTERQATKYYGKITLQDILRKRIIYNDSLEVFISGIIREPDYNSDFHFGEIISYATIRNSWLKDRFPLNDWSSTYSSSQVFIKVTDGTTANDVNEQMTVLDEFAANQEEDRDWIRAYHLQSLKDLHYNTQLGIFGNQPAAHLPTLIVLSVVASFLLLIAIFNFVNLETAQAGNKSKEVGVRKVMGSSRAQLVGRFLSESMLVTFGAVILSVPIAYYGLVFFEEFIPDGVSLGLGEISFWLFLIGLTMVVGTLAGIYPSLVISSLIPVVALKSGANLNLGRQNSSFLRRILISFQFLFSQLLIVGTLAVLFQISFMLDKDLGFESEDIIYFNTPYYESDEKKNRLIEEIKRMPEIREMSVHESPPAWSGYMSSIVTYQSLDEEIVSNVYRKAGDNEYIGFYGIELIEGRNVGEGEAKELLINETYMRELGFENPRDVLGIQLKVWETNHEVVGIIEDFHYRSLHTPIESMMIKYQDEDNTCIALKISMQNTLATTIEDVADKWSTIYPNVPLEIHFLDESIAKFYQTERKTSKLVSAATTIAIFISCLGLFGLISFTIVQKSKELGIRKVLGASLLQIGSILSKEFILLIVISFIISTPMAYYVIKMWLTDFAYQTEISWWMYGLGGLASMIIALFSISAKVWKASQANPIESLRYE